MNAVGRIKAVGASNAGSFILSEHSRKLYVCGDNAKFGLGTISDKTNEKARIVHQVRQTKFVVCAGHHALEIVTGEVEKNEEDYVMCTGTNKYSQLGNSSSKMVRAVGFKSLKTETVPKYLATGLHHSFIVDNSGVLYGAGLNDALQLGFECESDQCVSFTRVADLINNSVRIVQASAGERHSVVLDENNEVWTAGGNIYGQLGRESHEQKNRFVKILGIPRISQISAGYNHTLLLDENNCVWVTGCNEKGQLGLISESVGVFTKVELTEKISFINAGPENSIIITVHGQVLATGKNSVGQLGLGDNEDRCEFSLIEKFGEPIPVEIKMNSQREAKPAIGSNTANVPNSGDSPSPTSERMTDVTPISSISPVSSSQPLEISQPLQNRVDSPSVFQSQHNVSSSLFAASPVSLDPVQGSVPMSSRLAEFIRAPANAIPSTVHTTVSQPVKLDIIEICDKFGMPDDVTCALLSIYEDQPASFTFSPACTQDIHRRLEQGSIPMLNWQNYRGQVTGYAIDGRDELARLLQPLAEQQNILREKLKAKIANTASLTVDDVCLLLRICKLPEMVSSFRMNNIDGEILCGFVENVDFRFYKDSDWTANTCARFAYCLILIRDNLLLNEHHETQCEGCTADLLNNYTEKWTAVGAQEKWQTICTKTTAAELIGVRTNIGDLCAICRIEDRNPKHINTLQQICKDLLRRHKSYWCRNE